MSHTGKTIALYHRNEESVLRDGEDRSELMTSVNKDLQSQSTPHLLGGIFYLSTDVCVSPGGVTLCSGTATTIEMNRYLVLNKASVHIFVLLLFFFLRSHWCLMEKKIFSLQLR